MSDHAIRPEAPYSPPRKAGKARKLARDIVKYRYLFLLMSLGMAYFIIFCYGPLYGIQLAFKDFVAKDGIWGSPFVGLKYFRRIFSMSAIGVVVWNTVRISFLQLVCGFPMPIILALLLNEIRAVKFKRVVQTISYMPYFLSWVVVGGLVREMLSPSTGPFGYLFRLIGKEFPLVLASPTLFIPMLIITNIWKNVGYGTVIYLAVMSNINPELYEAATIDGAGRLQRAWYVTIPGLMPIITLQLILSTGGILNAGFDQIFNLYNPSVLSVADIIDTYVYRIGLAGFQYSLTTAIGLLKNIISFVMVFGVNLIARKFSEYAIW